MKPVQKKTNGWWITDPETLDQYGPYDTKALAEDDARGIDRFYQREANRRPRKDT